MADYRETIKENERVVLDDNSFVSCQFRNCQLVYNGGTPPKLNGCEMDGNCKWVFGDAAMRTLGFMQAIYHGCGNGGKVIIRDTFEDIKNNRLKTIQS